MSSVNIQVPTQFAGDIEYIKKRVRAIDITHGDEIWKSYKAKMRSATIDHF